MDRSIYKIDDNFDSSYVQTIDEIPPPPNYTVTIGLLLGISRRVTNDIDPMSNRKPYYLHMTDFTENRFNQFPFFNNRNFKKEELTGKTYDIVMYPQCFDYLCKKLDDKVNLYDHVRLFDSVGTKIYYVDGYSDGNNPKWYLDKFKIWLLCKVKEKMYCEISEFSCVSSFSVILEKDIKTRLINFQKSNVWHEFNNVYNNFITETNSDSDLNADHNHSPSRFNNSILNMGMNTILLNDHKNDAAGNSFAKRRKISYDASGNDNITNTKNNNTNDINYQNSTIIPLDGFTSTQKHPTELETKRNNMLKLPRTSIRSFTIPGNFNQLAPKPIVTTKLFDFNYTLVTELKNINEYKPQYIIIKKFEIIHEYKSYVYETTDNGWGIKTVKLRVFDEKRDKITIYLKESKLLNFLKIDKTQFKYINSLNEAIKQSLIRMMNRLRNDNEFIGLIVVGYEISPNIWKWRYEFSTDSTFSL